MAAKKSKPSWSKQVDELTGSIAGVIVALLVGLSVIYWIVVEIVLPFVVGLFFFALAIVAFLVSSRILAGLFAYLTFVKRHRRKIEVLSERVAQLDEVVSRTTSSMENWPDQQRLAAESEIQKFDFERRTTFRQLQVVATAMADHLADKLDRVNNSRTRISRRIANGSSAKLTETLARRNDQATLLEAELERLKSEYYIEPDPAFKRRERKYPALSKFDDFIASLLSRAMSPAAAPE